MRQVVDDERLIEEAMCSPKSARARMRWKGAVRSWKSARRGSAAGRPEVFIHLPNLSDRVTTRSNRCSG